MTARSTSIKTRIIATLVLFPLISLVAVGAIALFQNSSSLTLQGERNLEQIIREKTTAYNHIFQRIQQEAESASRYMQSVYAMPVPADYRPRRMLMPWTGRGYGAPEMQQELREDIVRMRVVGQVLEAMVAGNPYLTLGYAATESGITMFHDEKVVDIIEAIEGFDPRARPWYRLAREKRGPTWTELYVDAHTKKLTVTAAAPVPDASGRLLGVVGFDVLLETLQNDILNIDIGYRNEPFMIDGKGKVIVRREVSEKNTQWWGMYEADNLLDASNASFRRLVERMTAGESGIGLFADEKGQDSYLVYAPVPTVGASLGVIVPRSEIVKPVQESGKLVIIVLAVFIVVAIGLGLLLGNQVTRPIEELTVLVDKASKGLVDVDEIPIKRMDELGVLAQSFNRMLANLATVLKELERKEMGKKELAAP